MKSVSRSKKRPAAPVANTGRSGSLTLFDRLERHFERRKGIYVVAFVAVAVLLGLSQFNYKVSEANDDSMYLEDAFRFSRDFFGYYSANAPFYSMLLSLLIKAFGFDLLILKFSGFVFMALHLYFLFRAFEKRVPYLVLYFVLFFTAVNYYMLYFASMTFTEQFFMMQQGLFFYLFFRACDRVAATEGFKRSLMIWLPTGLSLFILSMSRNVAIGILIPAAAFLVYDRRYKHVLALVAAFAVFRLPFEAIRRMAWGSQDQYSNQLDKLLRWKDPYDPAKGMEDFGGYIDRFTGNYGLYVSKRFYQILGFLGENDYIVRPGLGFIFFVAMVAATVYVFRKKDKTLLFVLLYTGALCGITFIVMQTRWDQLRFILVFVPLILLYFFTPLYHAMKKGGGARMAYLIIISVMTLSVTLSSFKQSASNLPVVRRNIEGDLFYGYTEDWQNYLKLSRWCADSLPADAYVACRKGPMSFIYGKGKQFYPVYQVGQTDPDSVMQFFRSEGVTHIILASLRRNPQKNDGYIINTMHRYFQPAFTKYPGKFQLVKKMGESEPAFLYKINY